MANNFRIKTPHAAVLVWNYVDRIGTEHMTSNPQSSGVDKIDQTEPVIISTLSCVSIETSKSKGQPEGTFQLVLAPFRNWVSTLTAGSWCCLLMSNEPITADDLRNANKRQVKMIGKIESVKVDTRVDANGERRTLYYVSGVDWGHIFNSVVYVDNLIAAPNEPRSQGNAAAVAIRNILFAENGTPKSFFVKDNLNSIVSIFGKNLQGFEKDGSDINRIASAVYNFRMPKAMVEFFDFRDSQGNPTENILVNKILNLITGSLKDEDTYVDQKESKGFIDPFSLQGQHTFWQILMENSNPVLNEMFAELRWNMDDDSDHSLALSLYNRIKPFSYKGFDPEAGAPKGIKSFFQLLREHSIDDVEVISVNAGTNWRDKYNFIEVKPNFQDFNVIANWVKQKAQVADLKAFEREGFRPLIMETKQFPSASGTSNINVDWSVLQKWLLLMREWYFNTHRMLSGTIVLHGTTEYIAVGDNISFDAGLINPTPNMNFVVNQTKNNEFVLAHVESVSNAFTVSESGSRSYTTTIHFVRGLIVDENNIVVSRGTLDKFVNIPGSLSSKDERNTANVLSTSDPSDPDKPIKGN